MEFFSPRLVLCLFVYYYAPPTSLRYYNAAHFVTLLCDAAHFVKCSNFARTSSLTDRSVETEEPSAALLTGG